ncbi:hypothetical protein BKA62DRAFT_774315 [Auriculariales sp. MPI-PUGE-AT-0066]|nr:hypothetical protein BKA62DRAFT_774315 [Auriculariales sp. MPI-PUGE-AT-0066]
MALWKTAFLALCVLPFVSAFIQSIVPLVGTYHATSTSTLSVTFTSSFTKVNYYDLTLSFAVIRPAQGPDPSQVGVPIFKNIDLIALKATDISTNLTVKIPVFQSDLYDGPGDYKLTAIVSSASGLWPQLVQFTHYFSTTLNAKFCSHNKCH